METKQIVQASANVIRITKLTKGDIYKRFDDNYSYLGIVQNIYNDGNNAIIESTEYRNYYGDLKVEPQVLRGDKDYVIFPATLDDFNLEFESIEKGLNRKIESAEKEIASAQKSIEVTRSLRDGTLQKSLQSPQFVEMSQGDFDQKTKMLGM